jgi:hypothetical protein
MDDVAAAKAALEAAEEEAAGGTPVQPGHVCHTGPLCAYWYSTGPRHHEDPGGCIHSSCMEIVHEDCPACQSEAMEAWYGDRANDPTYTRLLHQQRCPYDGSPLTYRATYGAPGVGQAWECEHDHDWVKYGGSFSDARQGVPELTIADVI